MDYPLRASFIMNIKSIAKILLNLSILILCCFWTHKGLSHESSLAESPTEELLNYFSTDVFTDSRPTDLVTLDDLAGLNFNQFSRSPSSRFDSLIDSGFWKSTKYAETSNSISYLGFNLGSAYSASGNSLFPMLEKSFNNSLPYLGGLPLPSYLSFGAYFSLQVTPISNQIYNEINTFGFRMIFKY